MSLEGITLNNLQGGSNPAGVSDFIGATMPLDELMKLMRNCACDIFPDDDSFCYLNDGNCEKNYVLEMNIYNVSRKNNTNISQYFSISVDLT